MTNLLDDLAEAFEYAGRRYEKHGYPTALTGGLTISSVQAAVDENIASMKADFLVELTQAKHQLVAALFDSGTRITKPGYFSKFSEDGKFLEIWVWVEKYPNTIKG